MSIPISNSKGINELAWQLLWELIKCSYFNKCESIEQLSSYLNSIDSTVALNIIERSLDLLHQNKFLATILKPYISLFREEKIAKDIQKRIEQDAEYTNIYWLIFSKVINMLNYRNIRYVLIKHYMIPHIKMLDVDIHICGVDEILHACEELNKLNAKFYTFRFFAHPFKLGIKFPHLDPTQEISVEIYPEIAVGRIIVAPSCSMINNAIAISIKDNTSIEVKAQVLPDCENLYTIITHDWYSQRIPLAAVILFLTRIHYCDINKLVQLGMSYGTIHSIYTFLKISLLVERMLDLQILNEEIRGLIEELQFLGKASINNWINDVSLQTFPVNVPYRFILLSMPYHVIKISKRIDVVKTLYDIYGHLTQPLLPYIYNVIKRMLHM